MERLPAAICENVVIPALEFVSSAYRVEHILAGLETKMVGVIQT